MAMGRWVEVPPEGSSGEGSSGGCGDFTLWDMTWLDHWGFVLFQSGLFLWWVFLQSFGYGNTVGIMLLPWPPQIGGKSPCSDKIHRHFWISHLFMVERWLNYAESICLLLNLAGALDSSFLFLMVNSRFFNAWRCSKNMLKLWVIPSFSCIFWIDDFLKFPIGQSTMTGERISHSHSQGFGEKNTQIRGRSAIPPKMEKWWKIGPFPHSWIVWGKIRPMITGCTPQSHGFWTPPYGSPKMGWMTGRPARTCCIRR